MKEQAASAEDLQEAAQDINRMAKQELTRKQKQELLKRMQEMREILRQQGAGGQKRMQRMQRFGQRARGQSGADQGEGQRPGQGPGMRPGRVVKKDRWPGSDRARVRARESQETSQAVVGQVAKNGVRATRVASRAKAPI
jgi:hypothetical protein